MNLVRLDLNQLLGFRIEGKREECGTASVIGAKIGPKPLPDTPDAVRVPAVTGAKIGLKSN
jgi:hypothetical protein